jgi:gas vesicle protein
MSQRDGFASGFLAGAIFGSLIGGVVGTLVASRRDPELEAEDERPVNASIEAKKTSAAKRRQMKASQVEGADMEIARRSLEDKIAQLNATIDEVRQQLGNVNSNSSQGVHERPSLREELR